MKLSAVFRRWPTLLGVNTTRDRIEPFALALGLLAGLTVVFYMHREGGAVVMCSIAGAGLIAGRVIGFSNRSLVPLALGLVVVLVVIWGELLPVSSHVNSALAHASGGLLVGWAVSEYLRDRFVWALWPLGVLLAVLSVGVVWELLELTADTLFTTDLNPSLHDSINDVTFGVLGGILGMLVSVVIPPSSHRA
jgi:hypothetical protein